MLVLRRATCGDDCHVEREPGGPAQYVELASQGEDVLITVDGLPKAKLTRPDGTGSPLIAKVVDMSGWLSELEDLRHSHSTGRPGLTVEQILDEDRTDRV